MFYCMFYVTCDCSFTRALKYPLRERKQQQNHRTKRLKVQNAKERTSLNDYIRRFTPTVYQYTYHNNTHNNNNKIILIITTINNNSIINFFE